MSEDTRHIRRRRYLKTAGALTVAGLAGCAGQDGDGDADGGSDATPTPKVKTVVKTVEQEIPEVTWAGSRIGTDGLHALVMRDQDFDIQNDFKLEIVFTGAGQLEESIVQGRTDTGNMSQVTAFRINNRSTKTFTMFRPFYKIHEQMVVTPSAKSELPVDGSLNELLTAISEKNMTVGTLGRGSSLWNIFALIVTEANLDLEKDFDTRILGVGPLFSAILQEQVDVGLAFDPLTSRILAQEQGHVVPFEYNDMWKAQTGHHLPIGEVAGFNSVIEENRDGFERMLRAWNQVGEYIVNNTQQVMRTYQDHYGLKNEKEFQIAADRMSDLFYDGFSEDGRQGSIALVNRAYDAGLLEKKPDIENVFVKPDEYFG